MHLVRRLLSSESSSDTTSLSLTETVNQSPQLRPFTTRDICVNWNQWWFKPWYQALSSGHATHSVVRTEEGWITGTGASDPTSPWIIRPLEPETLGHLALPELLQCKYCKIKPERTCSTPKSQFCIFLKAKAKQNKPKNPTPRFLHLKQYFYSKQTAVVYTAFCLWLFIEN